MTQTIKRELSFPEPPEQVWRAIASSESLADWMFPNDFEPRIGYRFTFQVPPSPQAKFDGITVSCQVLQCAPPSRLEFSWSAGGIEGTRVSFRLEPDGRGQRLFFEHSGFDLTQPFGNQAFRGAEYGWTKMLGELQAVVSRLSKS